MCCSIVGVNARLNVVDVGVVVGGGALVVLNWF